MICKEFVMRGKALEPNILGEQQRGLIIPIGDVQWGSPDFPMEQFLAFLHWGMNRNAYFLGMGDWMDFSSFTDRKVMAPMRDSTREVLDGMVEDKIGQLVKQVAFTKGRWIGFIEGNHQWTFRDGSCVEQLVAGALGSDFLGTMAFVRLISEDRPPLAFDADTILCAHHGYGGGRTPGARAPKLGRVV